MKTDSRIAALIASAFLLAFTSVAPAQQKVEVTNNQPFPIAMPVKLLGDDAPTVMVNVEANGKQTIDLSRQPIPVGEFSVEPVENGVRLTNGSRDLGTLSWDLLFEQIEKDVP